MAAGNQLWLNKETKNLLFAADLPDFLEKKNSLFKKKKLIFKKSKIFLRQELDMAEHVHMHIIYIICVCGC